MSVQSETEKKTGVEKRVDTEKGTSFGRRIRDFRVLEYLRETWYELRKVSWPTRSEAVNLTIIVVSVTTFLSLVLGAMDWLFSTLFGYFLNL